MGRCGVFVFIEWPDFILWLLPKTACCQSEATVAGENNLALSRATATNRKADIDKPGALTVPGAGGYPRVSERARTPVILCLCMSVCLCVPLGASN